MNTLKSRIKSRVITLKEDLHVQLDSHFATPGWRSHAARYRNNPAAFAREVLGSNWWSAQEAIAKDLVRSRRVAVKSANAVGKTYLAADLALWFLYTHQPSIVITCAPTDRQVRLLLWQEIRKRHTQANSLPSSSSSYLAVRRPSSAVRRRPYTHTPTHPTTHTVLPGNLLTQRLMVQDGWYAVGYATHKDVKFQGFHSRNLLIIFDEASGIPESLWEAAEGVAVGENNKILALGNPLQAEGHFYRCFANPGNQVTETRSEHRSRTRDPIPETRNPHSGWSTHTISAIDHPNIIHEKEVIPGCITIPHLEDRIAEWCEPLDLEDSEFVRKLRRTKPGRRVLNRRARSLNRSRNPIPETRDPAAMPDIFEWDGIQYRTNGLFKARVLGEFPDGNDESLIPLRWIEAAVEKYENKELTAEGYKKMAVDVARFGDDDTVIGVRIGPVLQHMEVIHGADTMAVARRINELAYKVQPEQIAVDSIGIGAGVVDRLRELGTDGILPVNVACVAYDPDRFANRRAELYWGLREKFHEGTIAIKHDPRLIEELAAIRYQITAQGTIRMERKHQMKRRLKHSPDRADMLAMLFDGPVAIDLTPVYREPSPAEILRREMQHW